MGFSTSLLVPVDLRALSWAVIGKACELSRRLDSCLVELLYVGAGTRMGRDGRSLSDVDALELLLAQLMSEVTAASPAARLAAGMVSPSVCLVGCVQDGEPAEVIVELAERGWHDFIVMGASASQNPTESVTLRVVRNSPAPVVIVPRSPRLLMGAVGHPVVQLEELR